MNNCTIILFGATGDLAKRKIIPAIYRLLADKKIDHFALIGVAFDDVSAQQMLANAREFIEDFDDNVWQKLQARSYYQHLNFMHEQDYKALHLLVDRLQTEQQLSGNRLLYCATASQFFCAITEHIATSGLADRLSEKDTRWHRIVYEKPFGHNLASAQEINECIARHFNEEQIYRIDHYLSKGIVENIALMRFTNCVFEPLWDNRYIDNVQIILDESLGVDGRAQYYDTYGAIKDVVQNHMLELVALVAMEAPKLLTGEYIRNARTEVLKKVRFTDALLGQYEGYKQLKGVTPDSHTDTFAALQLFIDNPRWAGVPFYLKTGKKLATKKTEIHIKFKQVDCRLIRNCPTDSNYLTFKLAPQALFELEINAKKPDEANQVMPVNMEFCHSCIEGVRTPQAYETLLEEVMHGKDAIAVSVRFDEIEYAWKAVDALDKHKFIVYPYKPGTDGPQELKDFERKHGMRFRT